MNRYIGIDLGGTNLRAAIADTETGQIFQQRKCATLAAEGQDAVIQRIVNLIRELTRENGGLNGSGPTKKDIWAGTVRAPVLVTPPSTVEVSEIASTNSFHAKKKVRIAAVNTPGAARGTITFRNACQDVAPSTCAACSISHGISRKNADSV